jgi:hypothetical protein
VGTHPDAFGADPPVLRLVRQQIAMYRHLYEVLLLRSDAERLLAYPLTPLQPDGNHGL